MAVRFFFSIIRIFLVFKSYISYNPNINYHCTSYTMLPSAWALSNTYLIWTDSGNSETRRSLGSCSGRPVLCRTFSGLRSSIWSAWSTLWIWEREREIKAGSPFCAQGVFWWSYFFLYFTIGPSTIEIKVNFVNASGETWVKCLETRF